MSIEVRRYGHGPEVVVLHGGPGAPGSVASLARDLAAGGLTALEPLQRRSGDLPLTVAQHVADLAHVAPARAVLVGWSWGAMLGLSYAAAHPDRVLGVALVGCGTYDLESRAEYVRRREAGFTPEVRELKARAAAAPEGSERDRLLGELGAALSAAQAVEPVEPPEHPALPRYPDLAVDAAGNTETWSDVLRLQREGAEPAGFARITAPVAMLHGADDPHPGAMTRDALRPHVPHLEYVELERCGHEPWLERHPRERFLTELRRRIDAWRD